jgi:hypothetical protein
VLLLRTSVRHSAKLPQPLPKCCRSVRHQRVLPSMSGRSAAKILMCKPAGISSLPKRPAIRLAAALRRSENGPQTSNILITPALTSDQPCPAIAIQRSPAAILPNRPRQDASTTNRHVRARLRFRQAATIRHSFSSMGVARNHI